LTSRVSTNGATEEESLPSAWSAATAGRAERLVAMLRTAGAEPDRDRLLALLRGEAEASSAPAPLVEKVAAFRLRLLDSDLAGKPVDRCVTELRADSTINPAK